jgi:hypothetical protein
MWSEGESEGGGIRDGGEDEGNRESERVEGVNYKASVGSMDSILIITIPDYAVILVMFEEPSYTFNEEDGTGSIVIVKSGSVSEPFMVRVTGGKVNFISA